MIIHVELRLLCASVVRYVTLMYVCVAILWIVLELMVFHVEKVRAAFIVIEYQMKFLNKPSTLPKFQQDWNQLVYAEMTESDRMV